MRKPDSGLLLLNGDGLPDALAELISTEPGVSSSQPLNEFRMQGSVRRSLPARGYNDRLYPAQRWNLSTLHRFATGRGVTIAVIDSRIDKAHPDLAGQIAREEEFSDEGSSAAERHGTGVAGIIAARPGNHMGIAGVAPGARILGLRACWERPGHSSTICDSLSLAKALTYALEKRTKVINLSLSGLPDRLLSTLISRAISRGTIVIAALDPGNPRASFPASEKGVIAVADERLSSRDSHVYIAPGVGVPTTAPEGKWNAVDGSSYAAAHVSGLAALLREVSPRRSAISFLGSGGSIDACAAMARITALDERSCRR